MLHVTCHMSLVTCHVFLVKHLSILLESQGIRKYMTWYEEEENFTRQLSLVTCNLSLVTCHMSLVTCYLSHVYTKMYSWNHKELRKYWYVEVWKPILCCQAKWGTSSRGEVHSGGVPGEGVERGAREALPGDLARVQGPPGDLAQKAERRVHFICLFPNP